MSGPVNAVVGDNFGTDLPQVAVDQNQLAEEEKMARYSKTAEFKRIENYIQARIKLYQQYLPDGRPVDKVDIKKAGDMWVVANAIIGEFQAFLNEYTLAKQVIEDRDVRRA